MLEKAREAIVRADTILGKMSNSSRWKGSAIT